MRQFWGSEKSAKAVLTKEVLIVIGIEAGASVTELSTIIDLDTSTMSRRNDTAREKLELDRKIAFAKERVTSEYHARIAQLQD